MNKTDNNKIRFLRNKFTRRIYWPLIVSNEALWYRTNQKTIALTIRGRMSIWINHTIRKENTNITKQSLEFKKKATSKEIEKIRKEWNKIKLLAKNKKEW